MFCKLLLFNLVFLYFVCFSSHIVFICFCFRKCQLKCIVITFSSWHKKITLDILPDTYILTKLLNHSLMSTSCSKLFE